MPISPIVLQRRHAELGRIRLGAKRNGNGAPMKLEQFRLTSHSERYIRDLAELYGGEARPWDNAGVSSWEVYTDAKSIPVIAVKGGLSQWLETWSGGGCVHRCDGERGADGELCNPDDRNHQQAKPTTRLSVMLPELEAIGVWRLESHGWNAAAEIPAVAELAQYVGDLVPANLHLVERRAIKDGKTSRFVVPVLDLQIGTARLKEIVAARSGAGELEAGATGQQRQALEAGTSQQPPAEDPYADAFAQVESATTLDELAGIWDVAKGDELVGQASTPSARREEFVEAFKRRAHAIQEQQDAASSDQSGSDVVDGELVDDGGPDADAVWRDIVSAAGALSPPMTTTQVQEAFLEAAGVSASAASVEELRSFLGSLREKAGANA